MDLFAEVKDKIPIVEAMGRYGLSPTLKGNRYWLLCPFHRERTPSLCIYPNTNSFHCFGCGASGDVITFVSKLYNISFKDAAYKLADDFDLKPHKKKQAVKKKIPNVDLKKLYQQEYDRTFNYLAEINSLYYKVKERIKTEDDMEDSLFVEACHNQDLVEYWLDTLIYGDTEEILQTLKEVRTWTQKKV